MDKKVSVIIPAKNESQGLASTLQKLRSLSGIGEIIVVNDGSNDATPEIALENGAILISHPYSIGNGGAIKSGARAASGEILIFMDGDGQHDPEDIPRLIQHLEQGYDMVIGARSHSSQANIGRIFVNSLYNRLASYMTGQNI